MLSTGSRVQGTVRAGGAEAGKKFFVFSLDKTRKAFFVFQKRLPQKVTLFVFLIFGGKFRKIKNRGSNYTKPSLERKKVK